MFNLPMKAAVKGYAGALAVMESSTGYVRPGLLATGLIPMGKFKTTVDNTDGSSGDVSAEIESGIFRWLNSAAADEIAATEIGQACYIVDDQTVAKTSASGTRSSAGRIVDVDSEGVWVESKGLRSVDGDLVAANDLSDVADAATARANIGANKQTITLAVADLTGASALVYRAVLPACTIKKISSVLDAAIVTGDATITASIDGAAITTGVLTITQAGSAAGDVDTVTPSAANVATANQVLELTVGGAATTSVRADVTVEIEV